MTRELFIEAIEAMEEQHKRDMQFSKHLGKAFPNAFEANLTPNNEPLQNALIKVLQVATSNHLDDKYNWISYFIWELDFGRKNDELKVYEKDGKEIPLSNAGELYDFLTKTEKAGNKGNKRNGLHERWYDNGQLRLRTTYKDDKVDGLFEYWYGNGRLKMRATYKDGKPIGLREEWHSNGQISFRANYKDGKLNGLYEYWHKNGQIWSRVIYKGGKRKPLPMDVSLQELVNRGELDEKYLYIN